jgi:hypothetical protein
MEGSPAQSSENWHGRPPQESLCRRPPQAYTTRTAKCPVLGAGIISKPFTAWHGTILPRCGRAAAENCGKQLHHRRAHVKIIGYNLQRSIWTCGVQQMSDGRGAVRPFSFEPNKLKVSLIFGRIKKCPARRKRKRSYISIIRNFLNRLTEGGPIS